MGHKIAFKSSFGYALFTGIMFGCYAYGMSLGGVFVYEEVTVDGTTYGPGEVVAVYFGIIFGIFAIGIGAPNFKALSEG